MEPVLPDVAARWTPCFATFVLLDIIGAGLLANDFSSGYAIGHVTSLLFQIKG
ncbi:hypothetical protein ABRZ24_20145 [Brenneria populi]|uniref:Uncharacterized protein n=1 Tax=Brenneria populi TaxID=1505588 RepID=A0ABU6JWK7_9GAMM|nr:hypothetical protein [Brenneria populi Li et al. 2015]